MIKRYRNVTIEIFKNRRNKKSGKKSSSSESDDDKKSAKKGNSSESDDDKEMKIMNFVKHGARIALKRGTGPVFSLADVEDLVSASANFV
jgi:hypothetical protein